MRLHRVTVGPLPPWMPSAVLLGPGFSRSTADYFQAELPGPEAADLAARLRGLGFGGLPLEVAVTPPLGRPLAREARLQDARRRRDTTPGFTRPGVRLDEEGRYSLTPEVLALEMARPARGKSVVDAGCGAGGNAIAFARQGAAVTAVERCAERLADARHNAGIYGVQSKIHFILGDASVLALSSEILFVDPPWGVDWDRAATPLSALPLIPDLLHLPFEEIWLKAPPSLDTRALPADAVRPVFGAASGDRARVKFLLIKASPAVFRESYHI